MSTGNGKRNRGREPYRNGKHTPPQPGDEVVGAYSHDRLLVMDARFRQRVELAFAAGFERREAAAATHGANTSRSR